MVSFSRFLKAAPEVVGKVVSFLFIIIMLLIVGEVALRYLFGHPTLWVWDTNLTIFAISSMLAGGYALIDETHVRVDIIQNRLSKKQAAVLDLISFPILFTGLAVLLWYSAEEAYRSFLIKESTSGVVQLPLYPVKITIPVGAVLVLLSAFYKLLVNLNIIFYGEDGANKEG